MTLATLWAIFQWLGAAAGVIITLTTFFALISKKPRQAFRKVMREEATAANQELGKDLTHIKENLDDINDRLAAGERTDVAILRNTITHIYFKFKDQKKIPHYEKENVLSLYERYSKLKGNSYVSTIVAEIKSWDEIL